MKKLIIPCVYLKDKKLIKGFGDNTVVSSNPVSYCVKLSVSGADAILVFDLSNSDEEHEEALLIVRSVTKAVDTPVYGAGNVKRLEDVKKLLYAGPPIQGTAAEDGMRAGGSDKKSSGGITREFLMKNGF